MPFILLIPLTVLMGFLLVGMIIIWINVGDFFKKTFLVTSLLFSASVTWLITSGKAPLMPKRITYYDVQCSGEYQFIVDEEFINLNKTFGKIIKAKKVRKIEWETYYCGIDYIGTKCVQTKYELVEE